MATIRQVTCTSSYNKSYIRSLVMTCHDQDDEDSQCTIAAISFNLGLYMLY